MKKFWDNNKQDILFTLSIVAIWRVALFLIQVFSAVIPLNVSFGKGPLWQNFDGYHYQYIAHHGYGQYEQAFFPLFPLVLSIFEKIIPFSSMVDGVILVSLLVVVSIFIFIKLLRIDVQQHNVWWIVIFFLAFPTSFFLGSVYTESLFMLLVLTTFYFSRKNKFLIASIFAGLASATRLVGIFLLFSILIEYILFRKKENKHSISTYDVLYVLLLMLISSSGLLGYMFYLQIIYHDSLLFVHALPHFATGREIHHIVLLPQVFFRYIKIFMTVHSIGHDLLIAILEFLTTCLFLGVLVGFYKKMRLSYLIFSLLAIVLPTISGTLTSLPRYVIVSFPVFILFGDIPNKCIKFTLLVISVILLCILCAFFLRGYFIA